MANMAGKSSIKQVLGNDTKLEALIKQTQCDDPEIDALVKQVIDDIAFEASVKVKLRHRTRSISQTSLMMTKHPKLQSEK